MNATYQHQSLNVSQAAYTSWAVLIYCSTSEDGLIGRHWRGSGTVKLLDLGIIGIVLTLTCTYYIGEIIRTLSKHRMDFTCMFELPDLISQQGLVTKLSVLSNLPQ